MDDSTRKSKDDLDAMTELPQSGIRLLKFHTPEPISDNLNLCIEKHIPFSLLSALEKEAFWRQNAGLRTDTGVAVAQEITSEASTEENRKRSSGLLRESRTFASSCGVDRAKIHESDFLKIRSTLMINKKYINKKYINFTLLSDILAIRPEKYRKYTFEQ